MAADDPIISAEALHEPSPRRVWIDARPGPAGAEAYAAAHVEGAHHLDLDTDLSAPVEDAARGGRHPLPAIEAFCTRLGALGITPESEVIAYDGLGGQNAAARVWWLLRAIGHRRVWVLDGGLSAAIAAGLSLTDAVPTPTPVAPYPATGYDGMPTADADAVERARHDPDCCVIDVRAAPRYRGEHEPIDPVAGHIPGAINVPLTDNLTGDERFVPADALRHHYLTVLGKRAPAATVVHCGSGVTACHTLLALERAGLGGAALYVGSWSEWCRNPDRPRETSEQ